MMNLGDGGNQPWMPIAPLSSDDEDFDPHMSRIKDAQDESDEEDDGGSAIDDSGEDQSDACVNGDEIEKPAKKDPTSVKASSSSSKKKSRDGDEDGVKNKKDPNAPIKRAMSGFMLFALAERENTKKENPGFAFSDVGKVLGEKWRKMTAEEKEPYEEKAGANKKRYKDQIGD